MDITITPRTLSGKVCPPPSKSQSHRLLIAAGLADGLSILSGIAHSQDIDATIGCMRALGADIEETERGVFKVRGIAAREGCLAGSDLTLDCGESGSTLRFLIPIVLALAGRGKFTGRGRLLSRPQEPYAKLFAEKGVKFTQSNEFIEVEGALTPGDYALAGNVSSQFFTGLLYALPLLSGESTLRSTTALESASYLDMTAEALEFAGIETEKTGEESWHIRGGITPTAFCAPAEGDWSQGAFWLAAEFAGCDIETAGLRTFSTQGDRAIIKMLAAMEKEGEVTIDLSDCPDLLPPAAAAAALRAPQSLTRFVGAARLRLKESDRLSTVAAALSALGCEVQEGEDFLTVTAAGRLRGGVVDAANDHRIAMMAAVAAVGCEAPVTVKGAECVKKSYPEFWEVYESLGGSLVRKEV